MRNNRTGWGTDWDMGEALTPNQVSIISARSIRLLRPLGQLVLLEFAALASVHQIAPGTLSPSLPHHGPQRSVREEPEKISA